MVALHLVENNSQRQLIFANVGLHHRQDILWPIAGVHNNEHSICILGCLPHTTHHPLVQLALFVLQTQSECICIMQALSDKHNNKEELYDDKRENSHNLSNTVMQRQQACKVVSNSF